MKKSLLLLLLACCIAGHTNGQQTDKKLERKIQSAVSGYKGTIGVYVKNLRTGKTVAVNADTLFPTASIVKVPIWLGIAAKLQTGELHYDSLFTYTDSLFYAGSDILGSFKSGEKIALKKLVMLMLTTSDNTASLWLQSIAGTGIRINQLLDSLGFTHTRVNSRTPGREQNRTMYGWGQTTPREMGQLFERFYRKELFSPAIADRILRNLGRNFWDVDEGISVLPPTVEVFSKNGCVNASRSEVMLVNLSHNPYIFCIFTKNNQDTQWTHVNEAWTMARTLSALLYTYMK